jgi:hypothetical protein
MIPRFSLLPVNYFEVLVSFYPIRWEHFCCVMYLHTRRRHFGEYNQCWVSSPGTGLVVLFIGSIWLASGTGPGKLIRVSSRHLTQDTVHSNPAGTIPGYSARAEEGMQVATHGKREPWFQPSLYMVYAYSGIKTLGQTIPRSSLHLRVIWASSPALPQKVDVTGLLISSNNR